VAAARHGVKLVLGLDFGGTRAPDAIARRRFGWRSGAAVL